MSHRDQPRIVCKNTFPSPPPLSERHAELLQLFLDAGEALAHYIGDSQNRVETAWALRGFIETIAKGDGANDQSGDAGIYRSDYRRGERAAIASEIDVT